MNEFDNSTMHTIDAEQRKSLLPKLRTDRAPPPDKSSSVVRNVLLGFGFTMMWTLCALFTAYIFGMYLTRPARDWANDFGKSLKQAIPMMTHWVPACFIMILGPFQLLQSIRRWKLNVHRWAGRIYVVSAFIASLAGCTYVALNGTFGGLNMSISFFSYGVVFFACAAMTWIRARQHKLQQHRCWALRTFVIGLGTLIFRLFQLPLIVSHWMPPWYGQHLSPEALLICATWLNYIPNLLGLELYLWRTIADRSKLY